MSNSGRKQQTIKVAIALTAGRVLQAAMSLFVISALGLLLSSSLSPGHAEIIGGPLFSNFHLTLESGRRTEVLGPVFYSSTHDEVSQWALPPLMSYVHDSGIDSTEFDILYPALTYDRYGREYRFQIFQLFNFAGGQMQTGTNKHRFSLFPIYLQQRSADDSQNYISLLPIYGHLENRFFRDEVFYVLMPLYVHSRKRDIITDNFLFPIFHLRHGSGLKGWQVWPIVGHEHKVPTTSTNTWNDPVEVPGHDRKFVLWPFFLNQWTGLGSTNEEHTQAVIPFYSYTRSPLRDATSIPFALGWSSVRDRGRKYNELGAPWPFVVFRRGETANTTRVWPFYSRATNEFLESTWYMWPVYKYNRVHSDPLDRDRTRILLYLYSDIVERNTEAGTALRRRDLWPFFTCRHDWNGNERLQILAPLEPILPNSKSIERNYSPLWSLWRDEKNAQTGERSQSLLWNLYRRETSSNTSRTAALFGLVQHSSTKSGSSWRFFYWPEKKSSNATSNQVSVSAQTSLSRYDRGQEAGARSELPWR